MKISSPSFQNFYYKNLNTNKNTNIHSNNPINSSLKKPENEIAFGMHYVKPYVCYGMFLNLFNKEENVILPSRIDFKPFDTIDDARDFAKEYLKIEEFDLDEDCLEYANYILEGICEFNNTDKSHKRLVKKILKYPDEENGINAPLGICPNGVMYISKNGFEALEDELEDFRSWERIKNRFENFGKNENFYKIDEHIMEIYDRYRNFESLNLKDKLELLDVFKMNTSNKILLGGGNSVYANMLKDEKCAKHINENNYPTNIKSFNKLSERQKVDIINEIADTTGYRYIFKSRGPYYSIFHEMGHAKHFDKIGIKAANNMAKDFNSAGELNKILQSALDDKNPLVRVIGDEVSAYAMADGCEFVADVFATLKNGNKYCDEIMNKYYSLGGMNP